jgi:hypothetical protein
VYGYGNTPDVSLARKLAMQRVGRQLDGESDEEYAERLAAAMPKAESPSTAYMSEAARTRVAEAEDRRRHGRPS